MANGCQGGSGIWSQSGSKACSNIRSTSIPEALGLSGIPPSYTVDATGQIFACTYIADFVHRDDFGEMVTEATTVIAVRGAWSVEDS